MLSLGATQSQGNAAGATERLVNRRCRMDFSKVFNQARG